MSKKESELFGNVLLVEDDPSHSLLIQRALDPLVQDLEIARTVAKASERLQEKHFDLVITDLGLPDADGVRHVEELQKIQPEIAVVVLTVATRIEDVVAAMRYGAKDFILKSFGADFRELLRLSLSRVYSVLQVEEERKKLQTAIENSEDALALIDQSGSVRYGNRAFQKLIKRNRGDASNILSLVEAQATSTLIGQIEKMMKTLSPGGVWNTEVQLSEDGDWYVLTLSGLEAERGDQHGERRELVAWLRDISELKRKERFQRELISTTTHDLKGPMGAIITGAELAADLVEEKSRAAEILLRVKSAAFGVVNLIDEFLSARRIEDGSLILKPSEQSLERLFEEVQDNYETIADSRKIALTFDVDGAAKAFVDKMGFLRVMGNLLSNAMKFTASGGRVEVGATLAEGGDLIVKVSDTGSGIEADELLRIFERYSRLDQHQEVSGSGLGLFVVKSIVEAHGGSLQVESTVGEGTTFTIRFPKNPPVDERGELISLDFAK